MRRAPASSEFSSSFLDDRCRALDDLAGGDLIGEMQRQAGMRAWR
jgi:hypothetical protein